jgi:hypothetical protein
MHRVKLLHINLKKINYLKGECGYSQTFKIAYIDRQQLEVEQHHQVDHIL